MLLIALDRNYEADINIHASRGSDDRVGIIVLIKVFTEFIIPLRETLSASCLFPDQMPRVRALRGQNIQLPFALYFKLSLKPMKIRKDRRLPNAVFRHHYS